MSALFTAALPVKSYCAGTYAIQGSSGYGLTSAALAGLANFEGDPEITVTVRTVFPDIFHVHFSDNVAKTSRSTEHHSARGKVRIRQDAVSHDVSAVIFERKDFGHECEIGIGALLSIHSFLKVR